MPGLDEVVEEDQLGQRQEIVTLLAVERALRPGTKVARANDPDRCCECRAPLTCASLASRSTARPRRRTRRFPIEVGGGNRRPGARGGRRAARGGPRRAVFDHALVVRDQGEPVSISFDDLLKYYGRSSIAGLARAFKAMERGFPFLSPGGPPERYDLTVESGFPGGGAAMPLRWPPGRSRGPVLAGGRGQAGRAEAPGGHFFFRLGYRGPWSS